MDEHVHVLLFKSEKSEAGLVDPYRKALENSALRCTTYFTPVLRFEPNKAGLQQLRQLLQNDPPTALALTSPRASEALALVLAENTLDLRKVTLYVVGAATAKPLTALGFSVCGENAGSAKKLGEIIVGAKEKQVLFLCGDKRRDDLPEVLARGGVECSEVVVYGSVLVEEVDIPPVFTNRQQGKELELWCVFFSPSGLDCICKDHNMGKIQPISGIKVGAIGQTTASAVENKASLGFTLCAVAEKPNPKSLVQSLEAYYKKQIDT